MARAKQYNEQEVIEKAMSLFWRNGYESTSVRMLEKEMGINQFSIYASFGSKHGVFLESLKCYKSKINSVFEKLQNTYNEFANNEDQLIQIQMKEFMDDLKTVFIQKLSVNSSKDKATIEKQANYLLLAKHGLAAASRVNNKQEIDDYIELTFSNI